jgi:hypothetical protein
MHSEPREHNHDVSSLRLRLFFNHTLKRIREWVRYEDDSGIEHEKHFREREDEMNA